MLPLSNVKSGELCEVKWILLKNNYIELIKQYGIVVGSIIQVITNSTGHSIILVNEKRIALDNQMTNKIKVSLL